MKFFTQLVLTVLTISFVGAQNCPGCIKEGRGCTDSPSDCCEGLECQGFNFMKRCQPKPACFNELYACNPSATADETGCCDSMVCVDIGNGMGECRRAAASDDSDSSISTVETPAVACDSSSGSSAYDRVSGSPVSKGQHSYSADAFFLGSNIPPLDSGVPGGNRRAIDGLTFSQDGVGTDRKFGLDVLHFTGGQRSFVGVVTSQRSSVSGADDKFQSSTGGGFQDLVIVNQGTADFTMNDGQVFRNIRTNWVRGSDGGTFMLPSDGPTPRAFNAFKAMLRNNRSGIASFKINSTGNGDLGMMNIEGSWSCGQFAPTSAVSAASNQP